MASKRTRPWESTTNIVISNEINNKRMRNNNFLNNLKFQFPQLSISQAERLVKEITKEVTNQVTCQVTSHVTQIEKEIIKRENFLKNQLKQEMYEMEKRLKVEIRESIFNEIESHYNPPLPPLDTNNNYFC